jgi:hypothetical protein
MMSQVIQSRDVLDLASSGNPGAAAALEALLRGRETPIGVRKAAALGLVRVGTPQAIEMLTSALGEAESQPALLMPLLTIVARAADLRLLPAVVTTRDRLSGSLQHLARFTAALIAHRFGVSGHDLPLLADEEFVTLPRDDRSTSGSFQIADRSTAEKCLWQLKQSLVGVPLTEEPIYKLTCHRGGWMLLLNQQAYDIGLVTTIRQSPAVIAVLSSIDNTHGFTPEHYVLTAPAGNNGIATVHVPRAIGYPAWAGQAQVDQNTAQVRLQTRVDSSSLPIDMTVVLREHSVELRSLQFSGELRPKQRPSRSTT